MESVAAVRRYGQADIGKAFFPDANERKRLVNAGNGSRDGAAALVQYKIKLQALILKISCNLYSAFLAVKLLIVAEGHIDITGRHKALC